MCINGWNISVTDYEPLCSVKQISVLYIWKYVNYSAICSEWFLLPMSSASNVYLLHVEFSARALIYVPADFFSIVTLLSLFCQLNSVYKAIWMVKSYGAIFCKLKLQDKFNDFFPCLRIYIHWNGNTGGLKVYSWKWSFESSYYCTWCFEGISLSKHTTVW